MKRRISIFTIIILVFFLHELLFSQTTPILNQLQSEIYELIKSAKYSVVTVAAKSSHSYMIDKKDESLFSFFKSGREEKKDHLWTVGSGIIYNESGYIITRSSILVDFEEITVTLTNNAEFSARYIGTDEKTGLAVLKIETSDLTPITKGNSDTITPFSIVVVVGNSMGISPFASFGLINGITKDNMFILSASISPGNSGSPVFNLEGEVIGLISAQLDADVWMLGPNYMDYSGHQSGLVLPFNAVSKIVDEIIRMEEEQKGWLGIEFDLDSLKQNKLSLSRVISGSPADKAGLKTGDRLFKFNETTLANVKTIGQLIEQTKPGTNVSINFIRKNRPLKVFACIESKHPYGFNTHKPKSYNSINVNAEDYDTPPTSPIIMSPENFNQLNSRMIQMENEIQSLKSKLKNYQ